MTLNAKEITQAAVEINKLQQLLAFDLATTVHRAKTGVVATVKLELLTHNPARISIIIPASDIEATIAVMIEDSLSALAAKEIDTSEILATFRATGQQLLADQQNK